MVRRVQHVQFARTAMLNIFSTMPLYSLGLLAAIILAFPYWLLRMAWSGRYRDGLGARLGLLPRGLRDFVRHRPSIWVHAVSVGEVTAATRLIQLLDGIDPDLPVVISTTTRSGQKLAQERFGERTSTGTRIFYYPFDFAWIVRRYLRLLEPRALVLVESELWPRMILEAHRMGCPVIVVNGRVSDRSLPRYRALRRLWRPFLRRLSLVLAQSEQDRERFRAIGVPRDAIQTAGNLKYDVAVLGEAQFVQTLRAAMPKNVKVIVAGSTLEGEETVLLAAYQELLEQIPELVLVLAPRHPERFQAVAELVKKTGLECLRRSAWSARTMPLASGSVFLLDSIGELSSMYSLASVAFVGGSMVRAGGHNPLEPARYAVPIVMGPHVENFRGIVASLLERQAMRVTPPESISAVLSELLRGGSSSGMGKRAREIFDANAGASVRCFSAIVEVLKKDRILVSRCEGDR